jgi:hypothetical protein
MDTLLSVVYEMTSLFRLSGISSHYIILMEVLVFEISGSEQPTIKSQQWNVSHWLRNSELDCCSASVDIHTDSCERKTVYLNASLCAHITSI